MIGLFLVGFGDGGLGRGDERPGRAGGAATSGRSIMSRFHAGFSVGTVAGALGGAAMVALDVPVTSTWPSWRSWSRSRCRSRARAFIPDHEVRPTRTARARRTGPYASRPWAAWTEPRTLLSALFVLAFAFAEGAATTGSAWRSSRATARRPRSGTLAFAAFLATMTVGRWFGPGLLDRYGRVTVVRALAGIAIAGLAAVRASAPPCSWRSWARCCGVLGLSLGFPVGMSAGADDPALAAARVSVISSIGYCAFLAGPPLIGFIGEHGHRPARARPP